MKKITNFKKKILRIFNKNGGDGEWTKSFEKFSVDTKQNILNNMEFRASETPILLSKPKEQHYLLLTNYKLIEVDKENKTEILLDQIKSVKLLKKDFSAQKKSNWKCLEIKYSDNKVKLLEIEDGKSFFGFWNVLLFIVSHNIST